MPTSHMYQIADIMELILFTQPQSILDVGTGFGKYGFLSREYLELWDGKQQYCDWKIRIDGIEGYENYVTAVHQFIYNNVYIGNAINILPNLAVKYDLILVIDVLEHFEYNQGRILLKECAQIGKNMIVATPRNIGIQKDIFDNALEMHKSQWTEKDLQFLSNLCFIPNKLSLICYIGERSSQLRRSRINRRVGKYFPFLIPIAKCLKSYRGKI